MNQAKTKAKRPTPFVPHFGVRGKAGQPPKPIANPGFLSLSGKKYILAGLVLFTLILYGNTIKNDFALDDDIITRRNNFVQEGFGGIGQIFKWGFLYGFNGRNDQSYRPVTLTSVAIEKQIFGENPHWHHFFNVLYYAITAVFLFLVLLMVFRKYNFIVPLLITLLFIAHPVHTEVVANIKSRDEILSFMFCIISLYCSLKYYLFKKPKVYLAFSWVFFFIAILCKETVLMYFIVIPMVYYYFTDLKLMKVFFIALPFALLVLFYMFIRGKVLDSITFNEPMEVINNSLMAAKTGADRLATTMLILGKYIYLLFVPYSLSWDYSYKQIPVVSFSNIWAILSVLTYSGLIIYALKEIKKKDAVSFGIFYFLFTMLLVSNLVVKIGATMGERFLYTSSLGFCIAVTFLLLRLFKIPINTANVLVVSRKSKVVSRKSKVVSPDSAKKTYDLRLTTYDSLRLTTFLGLSGVLLLLYSFKTITRNNEWKDNFTLFSAGLETVPNSAREHESLAYALTDTATKTTSLKDKNDFFSRAIQQYYATLRILPNYSEAYYNLGWNFHSMGLEDSAKTAFERCLKVTPGYSQAYQYLGVISFNQKQFPEAISMFYKTLSENPNDVQTLGNLGAAYQNLGNLDSAIYCYKKALNVNPNLDFVKKNLAIAVNMKREKK